MEWSRDLDLDTLISANCWAALEEMEKVMIIPYHIDECCRKVQMFSFA